MSAATKAGYKETAVGLIPEEWECSTVRDIASPVRNAIVGGPFGSELVSRDYVEHGIPVIRGQNMSAQWVSGSFVFVTPAKAKILEANSARSGDIMFTQRGTLGQVSLVPEKPFASYVISQSQMKLSTNQELADPLFFFYVFTSEEQQSLIRGNTIQTGIPHINLGILRDLPVQVPPVREQRAIAEALSAVDALIGALDQLIAKKRDLKQGAMQQLLTGQKRLPGYEKKKGYRHTEVGVIPEDWQAERLGDQTRKVGSGITPTGGARIYRKEGRPFIRSQNIGWGTLILDDVAFIDDETHAAFKDTEIEKDDVFLNITGASIGRSAVADNRVERGNVNQHVCIIRTIHSELHPLFLNYFLLSSKGQQQIDSFQAGGNRQGLNFWQVRSMLVSFPPLAEQTAIASVLSYIDAELAALEQRRDKTRALRQGMMQELLTGRIRLV